MDPASRFSTIFSAISSNDYAWIIVVLVLLVVLSAYFSATETAYTSCNKIRLKSIESNEPKKAKKAQRILKQLDNYDRFLSTVLVGNNIVNIAASSLATVFFVALLVGKEDIAPAVSTIVTTVVVLIFGEVAPKTFAKNHPEAFAMALLPITSFFEIIFFPFAWALSFVKKLVGGKKESTITEDELITIVEEAENEGEIDEHESELIRSAIEFDDVDVYDIMVPRVKVVAISDDTSMEEIAKIFSDSGYSRLPVYHDSLDTIVGVIHIKDFYELYNENETDIRPIITNCICVSRNMKVSALLRLLQKRKVHFAIVVDEFGGTEGIVTLEDVIEELVGE
ncbi:MAG: HlyC/CorC family transporter, partial [Clostridia bacterium]|nr:HlyC/CorC family transporter [Clostridia bacterium]